MGSGQNPWENAGKTSENAGKMLGRPGKMLVKLPKIRI
jgi:hypothetical protein